VALGRRKQTEGDTAVVDRPPDEVLDGERAQSVPARRPDPQAV
jgi:hypothetical protein